MESSWRSSKDCKQKIYDQWGCVGCTFPNNIKKNNVFELRGLCWRTGFDTKYIIMNDKDTGGYNYIESQSEICETQEW